MAFFTATIGGVLLWKVVAGAVAGAFVLYLATGINVAKIIIEKIGEAIGAIIRGTIGAMGDAIKANPLVAVGLGVVVLVLLHGVDLK